MAVVVSFIGKWDGKDVERAQREIGKFADDSGSKFGGFAKKAGLAVAAVGAAAVGAGAIFAKQALTAAEEAGQAQARLDQVAQSMGFVGGAYDGATQRLQSYASELSKQIAVEDESILAVQAKLATFKQIGATMDQAGGAMDRATEAAFNLAAAGFGEAESNATQLGKALQDPIKGITALSRAGVTFTEQEREKIKAMAEAGDIAGAQNMILSVLEKQVGGVAEASATASDKMAVGFGELQESVGAALLPAFQELADTLLPVFEDLQGPLSEVAGALGGALSEALEALTPLIKPLAESFAQIAGTLGNVLVSAIQALIPPLTPVLELMGELAERIAPILQRILGRVSEVLVKVLDAVVPLLEPLTDLVFSILDAAMPIFDVVADVVLTLVDALTPLLDVVMLLLQPLIELVNVALAAILPVIEPILPVIEALAGILADILTRAIGLLMTAIGGLIVAFSKLAPFVLNNVTKPILDNFLKFAESLVGAASEAFSWVPGLGDKLETAKTAISGFRDDAKNAISDAADTISTEGERIGKDLIDKGVSAMTNPASVQRTRNAGKTAGEGFVSGMVVGIEAGYRPMTAAATGLVTTADAAARRAAEMSSPSKVFARIGKSLADGLVEGIKSGGDNVRTAMQESFVAWFSETKENLKSELDAAKEQFTNFSKSVSESITGSISFREAAATSAEDGDRVGMTFIDALRAQAEKAQIFAARVKELVTMNLSEAALQQVLAAGVQAGTKIADELIAGGSTAITETNAIVEATQGAADEAGLLAATSFYGAGVESAQQTYEGFKANFGRDGKARAAVMRIMDRLAADAARAAEIDVSITRRINEEVTRTVTTIRGRTMGAIEAAGATGGIVRRPTFALIGEAGPEAVVPLDRSRGNGPLSDLGGGNITINVTAGLGTDGAEVGRQIVDAIRKYERRSGRAFVSA